MKKTELANCALQIVNNAMVHHLIIVLCVRMVNQEMLVYVMMDLQ